MSFPPTRSTSWLLFMGGAAIANFCFYAMGRVVRRHGQEFPTWFGRWRGVRNFHQVARKERNSNSILWHQFLSAGFYISLAWCLFWIVILFAVDRPW